MKNPLSIIFVCIFLLCVSCEKAKPPELEPSPTPSPSPSVTPTPLPTVTPTPLPSVTPTPSPSPSPSPSPLPPVPACDFIFEDTNPRILPEKEQTLINGTPADIRDWPASVYARTSSSACSSTIVGERVVLSAGHCMRNNGTISFSVGGNEYTAVCTHHPEYRNNSTADWALCLTDKSVTGITFENVSSTVKVSKGMAVLLTGYGCTKPSGSGGNDGVFRTGEAVVTDMPYKSDYDVTTKGGAALCYGDSGGAAYIVENISGGTTDGSAKREIFGVNSRGDIRTYSYLPALGLTVMQNFASSFMAKHGVHICGLSKEAKACRDSLPPKPKYDFEVNAHAACVRGKTHKGYESKIQSIIEKVRSVLTF